MIILLDTGTAEEIEKMLPKLQSLDRSFGKETLALLMNLARGKIAELRDQYTQARQFYSEQLKLKPNSISARRKIARCYMKENQPGKAEALLKEINKGEPFEPQINLDLAELYWQMEKKELALKHLKTAAMIWQHADAHYKPARRAKELLAKWRL
jgi:predicted Zn-dependent protease